MRIIIPLLICAISMKCFAQTSKTENQISIHYSNFYVKGKTLYFVAGEQISFDLDSNQKYQVREYEQNTDSDRSKIKRGMGQVSFALNNKLDHLKVLDIPKNHIDSWISSLDENNYNKQNFALKDHFKRLTIEEIIAIAKETTQFKTFSSEEKLRQKLEQHFDAITELKDLSEFINTSKKQNRSLDVNNDSKEKIYIDCTQGGTFKLYRIYPSNHEYTFSPVFTTEVNMVVFKDEITSQNYNLDIYWLAFNFLPKDSLLRNYFNIEKKYINWFLKNKL